MTHCLPASVVLLSELEGSISFIIALIHSPCLIQRYGACRRQAIARWYQCHMYLVWLGRSNLICENIACELEWFLFSVYVSDSIFLGSRPAVLTNRTNRTPKGSVRTGSYRDVLRVTLVTKDLVKFYESSSLRVLSFESSCYSSSIPVSLLNRWVPFRLFLSTSKRHAMTNLK